MLAAWGGDGADRLHGTLTPQVAGSAERGRDRGRTAARGGRHELQRG